jgi:hypothetical protein
VTTTQFHPADHVLQLPLQMEPVVVHPPGKLLDVANFRHKVVELLLRVSVLLGHVLVFLLQLVVVLLERLHLPLVVAGLDVCLAESVEIRSSAHYLKAYYTRIQHTSLSSL